MIVVLVLVVLLALKVGCGGRDGSGPPPPATLRAISPEQILNLAASRGQPRRFRSASDVLPGGLSAAMLPMLIDWTASDPHGPQPYAVIHNVNYGGNPFDGTTVLQTVRVPLDGVERVEFTLVPMGRGGARAAMHHGQLRFVFAADSPVQLLDSVPPSAGGDVDLGDLVFSWEAWRKPGEGYNAKTGMDPAAYRLGLRVYAGSQRFLADALDGRDWYSTPLRLPGGAEGRAELLKVLLAMGDGAARQTISGMLQEAEGAWLAQVPTGADRGEMSRQWETLRELAKPREAYGDARLDLPPEDLHYQTVVRSCATLAYYCVTVAVDRLGERGLTDGVDREHFARLHLDGDEPWMSEVAATDLGGLFVRAPVIVRWLLDNPLAVPRNIPGRLDEAGLAERADGKRVQIHYSASGLTPSMALPDGPER